MKRQNDSLANIFMVLLAGIFAFLIIIGFVNSVRGESLIEDELYPTCIWFEDGTGFRCEEGQKPDLQQFTRAITKNCRENNEYYHKNPEMCQKVFKLIEGEEVNWEWIMQDYFNAYVNNSRIYPKSK